MDEKNLKPLSDTAAAGLLAETQCAIPEETLCFLRMANDSAIRPALLVRLRELGLLSAFLEAETETN